MKTQDEVAKSAEMCVIGAILIDEKALANIIQTLKPEHFYFDELKAAYQAILELSSEGKSIDFVSVLKKLVAKGIYDEKQAKQMLLECADLVPSISQAETYAKTVSDSFKARKLREIGTRLAFDGVFAENGSQFCAASGRCSKTDEQEKTQRFVSGSEQNDNVFDRGTRSQMKL